MRDDQLREEFARWRQTAQQMRAPDISVLRRRRRRRRARNTFAGVALCAVAAGSAALIHSAAAVSPRPVATPVTAGSAGVFSPSARSPSTRSSPTASPATVSTSPPAADAGPFAAPYFVVIDKAKSPSPATVRDWLTGKVVATVEPPAGAPAGGFTGVAGAGDDRTFVLAAGTGQSRFYQLILGQRGTPDHPPTLLPVPPLANAGAPFALSSDGSELAVALPRLGGTVAEEIVVVSLTSGSTRTWRSPDPGIIAGLSWADPGSAPSRGWARDNQLAFVWTDATPGRGAAAKRSGLRLLDTTAPGSDLLASRLVIPASVRFGALRGINDPVISSAGTVVFATMISPAGGNPVAAVVEFSVATGHPLRAVTPQAGASGMGTWCGALWTNPPGSQALAACGAQGEVGNGQFTQRDLNFPAPNASSGPDFFAW
jgi:hypothetical protein